MTLEKKYNWALTGLILMLIINIGLLSFLWLNAPQTKDWRADRGDRDGRGMHGYFQEQLNLSNSQLDSISTLRRNHGREIRQLRNELNHHRQAYLDFVLSEQNQNSETKDSLLNILTTQFAEIEQKMQVHMNEMRSVLDEDQQEAFRKMMRNAFSRNHDRGRMRHLRE